MKISTKGRYALRMLIDLAENRERGFVSLRDIAERQDISKKYLEQIVPLLNKSDYLLTNRGFQGGYQLAMEPDQYIVGHVLRLTEGSLAPVACLDKPKRGDGCGRCDDCITLDMWKDFYRVITDYLDNITLQDLLDRKFSI